MDSNTQHRSRRKSPQKGKEANPKRVLIIWMLCICLLVMIIAIVMAFFAEKNKDDIDMLGSTEPQLEESRYNSDKDETGLVETQPTDAQENTQNTIPEALIGTWAFGENTQYIFESNGSGSMDLEEMHFPYEYTVEGDQLYLNFESDSLVDASYTYVLDGWTLTLTGGEGTTGGTYELLKQEE